MASTEFVVVDWAPDIPITDDALDAMVSNDNWLRDNMVTGLYSANSTNRDVGIRIASGLALITSGKSADRSKFVSFNNYFSDGCSPIVTTGIVSSAQRQIFATIDGPGTARQPTRDGFTAHVHVISSNKKKQISRNFYVSWMALGY